MKKEKRTVVYDDELRIEAYCFEGIVQPFPNHFHEYYVIGFVEGGKRVLTCRNKEYLLDKGSIVLFNPKDNHACVQSSEETFDYRGFHIRLYICSNGAASLYSFMHHPCNSGIFGMDTALFSLQEDPMERRQKR